MSEKLIETRPSNMWSEEELEKLVQGANGTACYKAAQAMGTPVEFGMFERPHPFNINMKTTRLRRTSPCMGGFEKRCNILVGTGKCLEEFNRQKE